MTAVVGVTGTSGSGKTTLIEQLIACFVRDGRRVARSSMRITASTSIHPARTRIACARPAAPRSCWSATGAWC